MAELKPCPFCGSINVHIQGDGYATHIECFDCLAIFTQGEITCDDELIEAWNRRADHESAYLKASSVRPEALPHEQKIRRNSQPKKRRYFRKCGVCGERWEQSDMIRTDNSPNGWICHECVLREHPEYESEDW